ncbi:MULTISPECIES: universal stress protein [unclassified Achromobacter]|uniref:universal stress protein n=1 Tax=unclassified Achromobacter TaxID=2626865 RepID=UPI000B51886B|nr:MULTISPECIES: universal stress protein [unclassified Achromobacter]OWT74690.1 universal stress protein [Achromobacter sp. HZ34]OWT79157.1 universal stress protein [Achromobacter sp. HZ28]
MTTVLIPFDGSDCAIRAVQFVIDRRERYAPLMLHLLNVQIPLGTGAVRIFIDSATIRKYHEETGELALAPARTLLDAVAAPYTVHIKVGHAAELIAEMAREYHCDEIVMGSRGLTATAGLWLGSVTTRTLHLADVPVTVVK